MSAHATTAPIRSVTDGGLETDLIFHHGVDLPDFAAFVLVDDESGRQLLREYFDGYAQIARAHGVGLRLETPTWRASADWGDRLGYDAAELRRVNGDAVRLLRGIAADNPDLTTRVIGMIGPRGDGYVPRAWDPQSGPTDALDYHRAQVRALADAGVDVVAAYTLSDAEEAAGVVLAAREVGVAVEISFTVETDGRLATGRTLADTLSRLEAIAPPDGYLLNCAHPDHLTRAVDETVADRIIGIRPNASRLSHTELDDSDHLDEGDADELAALTAALVATLPSVSVIGGCCGTDARHVASMWRALSESG